MAFALRRETKWWRKHSHRRTLWPFYTKTFIIFRFKDFLRDHDPRPCQQYAMYQSNTHSKMCSNRPPVPPEPNSAKKLILPGGS